jgi:hypothetical protein
MQKAELNRLHIDNVKTPHMPKPTAADRHVDSWSREGKDGRWTRVHRSARRSLFTPFKVSGGPSLKSPLKKIRITRGKFLSSGKTFKIIDDWSVRANAHRMLESAWLGTTDFRETAEYIDDDSDEDKNEDSAASPRLVERESPSGSTSTEPQKETELQQTEDRTEYFELTPAKSQTSTAQSDLLATGPKGSDEESRRQPAQTYEQGRLDALNDIFERVAFCPSNSWRSPSSRGSVRQTPPSFAPSTVGLTFDRQVGTDGVDTEAMQERRAPPRTRAPPRRHSSVEEERALSAVGPPPKQLLAIDIIAVHGSGAWLIL